MQHLRFVFYFFKLIIRNCYWLFYKNKITSNGKVIMNWGSLILGVETKDQIKVGKHVQLSGWQ